VILAHYYVNGDIQDIADYIGDSLALAQIASRLEEPVIVLCGVNFMGETAKILCPDKTVLIPDMEAGCSLADSCKADEVCCVHKAESRTHGDKLCQHLGCREGTYRCCGHLIQCPSGGRDIS